MKNILLLVGFLIFSLSADAQKYFKLECLDCAPVQPSECLDCDFGPKETHYVSGLKVSYDGGKVEYLPAPYKVSVYGSMVYVATDNKKVPLDFSKSLYNSRKQLLDFVLSCKTGTPEPMVCDDCDPQNEIELPICQNGEMAVYEDGFWVCRDTNFLQIDIDTVDVTYMLNIGDPLPLSCNQNDRAIKRGTACDSTFICDGGGWVFWSENTHRNDGDVMYIATTGNSATGRIGDPAKAHQTDALNTTSVKNIKFLYGEYDYTMGSMTNIPEYMEVDGSLTLNARLIPINTNNLGKTLNFKADKVNFMNGDIIVDLENPLDFLSIDIKDVYAENGAYTGGGSLDISMDNIELNNVRTLIWKTVNRDTVKQSIKLNNITGTTSGALLTYKFEGEYAGTPERLVSNANTDILISNFDIKGNLIQANWRGLVNNPNGLHFITIKNGRVITNRQEVDNSPNSYLASFSGYASWYTLEGAINFSSFPLTKTTQLKNSKVYFNIENFESNDNIIIAPQGDSTTHYINVSNSTFSQTRALTIDGRLSAADGVTYAKFVINFDNVVCEDAHSISVLTNNSQNIDISITGKIETKAANKPVIYTNQDLQLENLKLITPAGSTAAAIESDTPVTVHCINVCTNNSNVDPDVTEAGNAIVKHAGFQ